MAGGEPFLFIGGRFPAECVAVRDKTTKHIIPALFHHFVPHSNEPAIVGLFPFFFFINVSRAEPAKKGGGAGGGGCGDVTIHLSYWLSSRCHYVVACISSLEYQAP